MTQSQFYGTKKWAKFAENIKLQRQNEEGFVVCDYCGKPILKRYDCIAHHKIELNDSNVNDASIALNPENIMLVHFGCHNKIHRRAERTPAVFLKPRQEVYLVYGSPCSGKTSYVDEVANGDDLILDVDRLWDAVCNDGRYNKMNGKSERPHRIKANVFGIRDCIIDQIRTRKGGWRNAFIIGGYPLRSDRERICELLNAKPIYVEATKEECMKRATVERPQEWKQYIENWFNQYVE